MRNKKGTINSAAKSRRAVGRRERKSPSLRSSEDEGNSNGTRSRRSTCMDIGIALIIVFGLACFDLLDFDTNLQKMNTYIDGVKEQKQQWTDSYVAKKKQKETPISSVTTTTTTTSKSATTSSSLLSDFGITSEGKWVLDQERNSWVWEEPAPSGGITVESPNVDRYPNGQRPVDVPLSQLLNKHNTSVVFYGSSHLREVYLAFLRLEQGWSYKHHWDWDILNIPSGDCTAQDPKCATGWLDSYRGIDVSTCGYPGWRLDPKLGPKFIYGFKTFLHTPDAEHHFLDVLEENQMRHPDIVMVDIGLWGARGTKLGGPGSLANTVMTEEQELDYYLNWVCESFPKSSTKIVFVYVPYRDPSLGRLLPEGLLKEKLIDTIVPKSNGRYVVLRKDYLMTNKPTELPCEHGCSGPVVHTMAIAFTRWVESLLEGAT